MEFLSWSLSALMSLSCLMLIYLLHFVSLAALVVLSAQDVNYSTYLSFHRGIPILENYKIGGRDSDNN